MSALRYISGRPAARPSVHRARVPPRTRVSAASALVEDLVKVLQTPDNEEARKHIVEQLRSEGITPKDEESMRTTFSGNWKVLGSSLQAKPPSKDADPGVPLSMLSFGKLPNVMVKMHGSFVVTQDDEYTLAHVVSLLPAALADEEHVHMSLEAVEFALALTGGRRCDGAPDVEVAFYQVALAPLCDEGGSARPESLDVVKAIAARGDLAVSEDGTVVVELEVKTPYNINVVFNDGHKHVHEGFSLYVLESVASAPLRVPPLQYRPV